MGVLSLKGTTLRALWLCRCCAARCTAGKARLAGRQNLRAPDCARSSSPTLFGGGSGNVVVVASLLQVERPQAILSERAGPGCLEGKSAGHAAEDADAQGGSRDAEKDGGRSADGAPAQATSKYEGNGGRGPQGRKGAQRASVDGCAEGGCRQFPFQGGRSTGEEAGKRREEAGAAARNAASDSARNAGETQENAE